MDLVKNRTRLGIVALALGWLADVLFFRQSLGINFPLFTLLTIAAGAWILYAEGARPAWGRSLILAGAALVFAFIPFVRQEPLTIFLSLVFCMVLLVGLALTARGGQWPRFSLSDWVLGFFQLLLGAVTGGGRLFLVSREKTLAEGDAEILIQGDQAMNYADLDPLLKAGSEAGIQKLKFAVLPKNR